MDMEDTVIWTWRCRRVKSGSRGGGEGSNVVPDVQLNLSESFHGLVDQNLPMDWWTENGRGAVLRPTRMKAIGRVKRG
jgi:hypothetical protein